MLITLIALISVSAPVQAADEEFIRVTQPLLTVSEDNVAVVEANVQVTLSPVLVDAVKRGVPLYFISEFELSKKRWYWFDAKPISQNKTVRLSYHAITQQFRVTLGGLFQAVFPTLDEALAAAIRLPGWTIVENSDAATQTVIKELRKSPESYEPRLRVRLDSAQLPKPLQVNALTNRDWNLSSDWIRPKLIIEPMGATQ